MKHALKLPASIKDVVIGDFVFAIVVHSQLVHEVIVRLDITYAPYALERCADADLVSLHQVCCEDRHRP